MAKFISKYGNFSFNEYQFTPNLDGSSEFSTEDDRVADELRKYVGSDFAEKSASVPEPEVVSEPDSPTVSKKK